MTLKIATAVATVIGAAGSCKSKDRGKKNI
jgi:hypothetical protein